MLKKLISVILVCIMALSLAGCADIGYTHVIEGQTIKAGIYLYYEYAAMNDFETEFTEKNPNVDISADGFKFQDQKLDGKDYTQWVQDKALEYCKRYVAINMMFDELGLSFTADEISEMKDEITALWENEDAMLMYYYGIDSTSWGGYYTKRGISKESLTEAYQIVFEKYEKIFHHYYDVGGEKEIQQQQIDEYLVDNYARVRYISVSLLNANGEVATSEEELAKFKELVESYTKRLDAGEKFSDVYKDYQDYLKSQKETESEDKDTEDEKETEQPKENDYDRLIQRGVNAPSEKMAKFIFTLDVGEAATFYDEKVYYAVIRLPFLEREDWVEKYTEPAQHALFDDELEEVLKEKYADFTVEANIDAVNKYAPTKIKQ
jgi:hypothetical protein